MEKTVSKKKRVITGIVCAVAAVAAALVAALAISFHSEAATLLSIKANEEKGIYEVNYSADYKLEDLLASGGVQTEDELVQYIIKTLLKWLPVKVEYEVPQLACSTFIAENPNGGYIFGRNLDNQETDLAVVRTAPKDGYASVSVVNLSFLGYNEQLKPLQLADRINMLALPYFPLDGVNEKGLAVGVLQLQAPPTQQDNGKTDVDTTLAIRALLDKAATVQEGIALLDTFDMHASANGCYHLHLADAEGNSAVVSYVDGEMIVTEKEGAYQACTNFYLHDVPFKYEKQGMDRYEKLIERLSEKKGILTAAEGMELLHYAGILTPTEPDEEGRSYSTQWSSLYDLSAPSLTLCADRDYSARFTYFVTQ